MKKIKPEDVASELRELSKNTSLSPEIINIISHGYARICELERERDEARRMYCEEVEHHHETVWNDGERDFKPLPALDVAISKGWDCFKEDGK